MILRTTLFDLHQQAILFMSTLSRLRLSILGLSALVLTGGCRSLPRHKLSDDLSEAIELGNAVINEVNKPMGVLVWLGVILSILGIVGLLTNKVRQGAIAVTAGVATLALHFTIDREGTWVVVPVLAVVLLAPAAYKIYRHHMQANLAAPQDDRTPFRLARHMPTWLFVLLSCLLGTSLVLNIFALLPNTAFIEMVGLMMAGPYSILEVVHMLWEHKLYPLAVLVIGFSVVFPPLKIGLASWAMFRPMRPAKRRKLLATLGHLGRWSLLDVFVALLLLIITSKQSLTGTTVSIGLYAFLGAIVLSMTSVGLLIEFNRRLEGQGRTVEPGPLTWSPPMLFRSGLKGWALIPLLFLAVMCLEMAVNLPLFKIDRFGLMSNEWSLWSSITELRSDGLSIFAFFMLLVLIIAPVALVALATLRLVLPVPCRHQGWLQVAIHNVAEWCMLDVFALAMILYLSEERNFAHLDLKSGIWYLFVAMALFHLVMYAVASLMRQDTLPAADTPATPEPPGIS